MLRGLLNKTGTRSPEIGKPQEEAFIDPILPGGLDSRAILDSMGITMQSGTIKSAIERISDAISPIVLREILSDFSVEDEVLAQSARIIDEEAPHLSKSTRLLRETNNEPEIAKLKGLGEIVTLACAQYQKALAATPESVQSPQEILGQS